MAGEASVIFIDCSPTSSLQPKGQNRAYGARRDFPKKSQVALRTQPFLVAYNSGTGASRMGHLVGKISNVTGAEHKLVPPQAKKL